MSEFHALVHADGTVSFICEDENDIAPGMVLPGLKKVSFSMPEDEFAELDLIPGTAIPAATFDGSTLLAKGASSPTSDDVKAEAYRRIVGVCPEWRQRNLTARAAELALRGGELSEDEQAEVAAGQAVWDQIKAIRDASNALEAMEEVPPNYADDVYWP